jgi:hypothetical protein
VAVSRKYAGLVVGLLVVALLVVVLVLAGSRGSIRAQAESVYPGFATPQDALQTFFGSAQRGDYATTYSSYYRLYQDRVTEQEYVMRRAQAAALTSFTLGPVSISGDAAEATATLVFAANPAGGTPARTAQVHEDLARQAGGWKIRVW